VLPPDILVRANARNPQADRILAELREAASAPQKTSSR